METLLREEANKFNIELTDQMVEKFMKYKTLLKEWNEKINLTAIIEDKEIIIKHFIDSLTIAKYIPQNAYMIDVGTGAGFPGIPVKILRKDVKVVLLDSLNKRLNFLNEVIKELDLEDIETVHGRAEDAGNDLKYREKFDVATARAVANISTLSELCSPFVKVNGAFICMKANASEEIVNAQNALKILNLKEEEKEQFRIDEIDSERTIILYRKTDKTPKQYPRKAGTPAKQPL